MLWITGPTGVLAVPLTGQLSQQRLEYYSEYEYVYAYPKPDDPRVQYVDTNNRAAVRRAQGNSPDRL